MQGFSGSLRLCCVICGQFGRDGRRLCGSNDSAQGCNRAHGCAGRFGHGLGARGWLAAARRRDGGTYPGNELRDQGVAEKRRGLAGTGVWLLSHIFPSLFTDRGYRKNWRQGLENGGLRNILRMILCETVSRCIHEILSIDWACISCINENWDDGFASVIMRKNLLPGCPYGMKGSHMQT